MTPNRTPRETFEALVDGVARLVNGDPTRVDALAGLYAEHTHVTHPMSPFGEPPLRSREELRRHFAAGPGSRAGRFTDYRATDILVHETADPEVIVAEFAYAGRSAGVDFAVPAIFVMRVRDGEIVESRDYASMLHFARASGGLEELFEGVRQAVAT
jgi:ketosteroid isomerase-like protein